MIARALGGNETRRPPGGAQIVSPGDLWCSGRNIAVGKEN
jgi:hypothetical protein